MLTRCSTASWDQTVRASHAGHVAESAYDAGALLAAERGDRTVWALHRQLLARGPRPTVPAPVLARGLLHGCRIEPMLESEAQAAGAACAVSRRPDVADACVVVNAPRREDVVLTSDPDDLAAIAG